MTSKKPRSNGLKVIDERDAPKDSGYDINSRMGRTHDCAFLEPLAFPPDLPPVILMDLGT